MAAHRQRSVILLSILLLTLSFHSVNQHVCAQPVYTITVQGYVFNDTGVPAPPGTPVNISIYDGVTLDGVYYATVNSTGFYYNDTIDAQIGYNISVNASFNGFNDMNNATVIFGKASYVIHLGKVVYGAAISQPPGKSGNPGAAINYTFIITNAGNVKDRYELAVYSSLGWFVSIIGESSTGPLLPGETATVNVSVIIPPDALASTEDTLTLEATSVLEPTVSESVNVITTVNLVAGVEVIPPSSTSGLPGETLLLTFQVRNLGNGKDSFHLTVSSSNPSWACSTEGVTDTGEMEIGVPVGIDVSATVPLDANKGDYAVIRLRAASNTAPAVYDEEGVILSALQVAGVSVIGPPVNVTVPPFPTGHPGETIEIIFSVRNTGNGMDSFTLTGEVSTGWYHEIIPESIPYLGIDASAYATVAVTIPADAVIGSSATITLTATSVFNNSICDSKTGTITVVANQAPVAVIVSPLSNATFFTNQTIFFNASSSYDPDNDTLSYNWTSDIDGVIGLEEVFNKSLSEGTHTIRLKVTDGYGGEDIAEVIVQVTYSHQDDQPAFDLELWWFIPLIVILVIVTLFALRRKKRGEPDEVLDSEVQETGGKS